MKYVIKEVREQENRSDYEKDQRQRPYEDKLVEQAEKSRIKKLEKIGTLGFFELFPYK